MDKIIFAKLTSQQKVLALRGVLKINKEKRFPYTMRWKSTESIADDIYFDFDIDNYFLFEPVETGNAVTVTANPQHSTILL